MLRLKEPSRLSQVVEYRSVRPLNGTNCRFEVLVLAIEVVPRALVFDWCVRNESLAIKVEDIDRSVSFVHRERAKVNARNEVLVLVACHPIRLAAMRSGQA